jgi:ComF family protein
MPSASRWPMIRPGRSSGADAAAGLLRLAADSLLAVLLAPACAACQQPLDAPTRGAVCPVCWSSIVRITPPCCQTCGDPLPSWRLLSLSEARCARCRRRPPLVASARAIGPYEGSLRAILHALKYGQRRSVARRLGLMLGTSGADVLSGADAIVPVPLHPSRERARGFNQARELSRHLGVRMIEVLRRTRRTAVQADLPAARRHANVRGAFALIGPAEALEGLTVVLVDDVSTTGATLNACAAPLLAAGAKEVRGLTAARAVTRLR